MAQKSGDIKDQRGTDFVPDKDIIQETFDGRQIVIARKGIPANRAEVDALQSAYKTQIEQRKKFEDESRGIVADTEETETPEEKAAKAAENKAAKASENKAKK